MTMRQIIVLEPDEWDRFVKIMTTPCEPSPAMVAAAKRHHEWTMKPSAAAEGVTVDTPPPANLS